MYQGQLNSDGTPANGSYDLSFTLYATNATGTGIAGPVTNSATAVANGLFTTTIDFGSVFTGTNYWLEIAVSTNGANSFTTLAPRRAITPTPYALYSFTAGNAATAATAGSVAAANLIGTLTFAQLPASVVTNGGSVTLSGIFSGNGGGLIDINTTNLAGTVADDQLSTNVALLDGTNFFGGTDQFTGVVIATNFNNQIAGSFTGNGGGLTNLSGNQITGTIPEAQLPTSVVTNGGSVTLSGNFAGNGGGLTNINTSSLAGRVSDSQLSGNVALLNGTNGFTGTNQFAGAVIATNGNNQITGSFTGNGVGVTNLQGSSLIYTTNAMSGGGIFTFATPYTTCFTNTSFTFALPQGVGTTTYDTTIVDVTNSSGSVITITPPPGCYHFLGTWNCTNESIVTFYHRSGGITNGICTPLF